MDETKPLKNQLEEAIEKHDVIFSKLDKEHKSIQKSLENAGTEVSCIYQRCESVIRSWLIQDNDYWQRIAQSSLGSWFPCVYLHERAKDKGVGVFLKSKRDDPTDYSFEVWDPIDHFIFREVCAYDIKADNAVTSFTQLPGIFILPVYVAINWYYERKVETIMKRQQDCGLKVLTGDEALIFLLEKYDRSQKVGVE